MNKLDKEEEKIMYQQTIEAFSEWLANDDSDICLCANDADVLIAGYSKSAIEQSRYDLGVAFKLHEDEYVIWVRDTSFWNDRNQGCVVTDWGITIVSDNEDPESVFQRGWDSIERVEYKNHCIYLYDINNESQYFHLRYLLKNEEDYSSYGPIIANLFDDLAQSQDFETPTKAINRIKDLFDQSQYEQVVDECDSLLASSELDNDERYDALRYRAFAYKYWADDWNEKMQNPSLSEEEKKKIRYEEYSDCLMMAINDFEDIRKTYGDDPQWFYQLADCNFSLPLYRDSRHFDYLARRYAIAALDCDDAEFNSRVQNCLDRIDKQLFDFFNNDKVYESKEEQAFWDGFKFTNPNNEFIPFADRQFIMFAKREDQMAGYYDPDENIKWVFALNKYPNDIKVEGVPQANILYIANPVKPDTYLPYENAEDILFQSKIREFEYLVGCLGATEIRFRSVKGKKISSEREIDNNVKGDFSAKIVSGSANVNWGSKDSYQNNSSSALGRTQKLNPTKYPFIPDGLGWYNYVEEWRDFARQRLENGLTHYHYVFKSSESSSLSTQKKLDISASFKKMVVSINAHYSQNIKETIEIQEETEWEVEVEFMPLEKFSNQSGNAKKSGFVEIPVSTVTLNDNEQFYYDELQDVLADGVITENDRKRLERRRQRLNISEERAKEIEQMLSPSLTDDEQEYYDELFEVLDDGVIDDKERRSLDRLKRSLGISDSRAKEIEDMAFAKRGLK